MKQRSLIRVAAALLSLGTLGTAFEARGQTPESNLSLKLEIERALDRGLGWLEKQQDSTTGSLGDPQQPALTALGVSAWMANPSRKMSPESSIG